MPGGVLLDQARAVGGDFLDFVFGHVEDDLAESRRAGVVHVDDGLSAAGGGFNSACNQIFARLGQDDDGNVVGDPFFVDQLAPEIEVRLRCGGKADQHGRASCRESVCQYV